MRLKPEPRPAALPATIDPQEAAIIEDAREYLRRMRSGGGFELRKHGKAAAIDLEIGRFGNRGNFPGWRYAPMLVELDAEDIGRVRGDQGKGVVD